MLRLLFLLLLVLPAGLRAQGLTLLLRDSTSRQPLIGASVHVPGTGVGGTTDVGGRVTLTPTPAVGTRLRVAALGYRPRTVLAPVGVAHLCCCCWCPAPP